MTGRGRGDGGQAAVELALVLPLVVLVLLVVVQVVAVARDQVLVVHAAREAAREAAVDPDPGRVRRVAAASGLNPAALRVDIRGRGGPGSRVTVRVDYRCSTDVPLAGALIGDRHLRAAAVMRVEK